MTPEQFIAKWQANTRNERAACQEHFIDLCRLLDEPTPNTDPTGASYAFEKGATKATGDDGWADVWRKERFAWEYKGKRKDLDAAHKQLLQYAGALGNPPLLVVSDVSRIVVRTNWTNAVSERHDVLLSELADPGKRALLKRVFSDPERLRPGKTREALTAQAAGEFAAMTERLRARGHDPQAVAHFVIRLAFCLFASDVELLPHDLLARMLAAARKNPDRFEGYARRLFAAMAERGGEVDFTPVQWFNGGLFDSDATLPLEAADIEALERANALDWSEIDPSIMGTLFERGLDPSKRSQLGAHYTDRDKIMRIVGPVVSQPLAAEWEQTKGQIASLLERASTIKNPGTRTKTRNDATAVFRAFLDRLRAFRVLDPACGSGNFLYLSLLVLKDLEHRVMVEAEALGLQREFPQVGPEAVLGIEINPYAAELARVSVWIGHIQWARRHGYPAPSDPVLRPLETIECRDAVLTSGGKRAAWPDASVIIGNPPFLGGSDMLRELGFEYTERLRAAYADDLSGASDLVCYWFVKAREAIERGAATRAGLVATDAIRSGTNRAALDQIKSAGLPIFDAWTRLPWMQDGAAVRVSIASFGHGCAGGPRLDGMPVQSIGPNLAGGLDITAALPLQENQGLSYTGTKKGGAFDVPGDLARKWLTAPTNANGQPNSVVVRPWRNGIQITRRAPERWIIDFGTMSEAEAAWFALPFAHVTLHVKPVKEANRRGSRKKRWWQHSEVATGLRRAIRTLDRYIAISRVSKHRIFTWLDARILPDDGITIIARSDDVTFGIIHSRFHELWGSLLLNRRGAGGDPRYAATTALATFPFPSGFSPDLPAADAENDLRGQRIAAAARGLMDARDRWLNPPDLVERVPEVVPDLPDRILPRSAEAAAALKARTLTNLYNTRSTPEGVWLDNLHAALDAAVAAAYGWPADISDDDALAHLLALNLERSGG